MESSSTQGVTFRAGTQCPSWELGRQKLASYRRREPEKSVLYRVVSSLSEELERVWPDRYQQSYGVLRSEVKENLEAYLNCGLLDHGAARVYCENCQHSFFVAFSCKGRNLCPSCSAKRAVKFAEHLYDEILSEVKHRHIGCGIPKQLRPYFKYDRKLLTILFRAAWLAIKENLLSDTEGVPGLVFTAQTSGEALNWNPHLHGMISDCLFLADGTSKPLGRINTEALSRSFAKHVLADLVKRELIEPELQERILSQDHTGFNIWFGEPFEDKDRKLFVARYIERGPLSLEKLTLEHDILTYTSKDGIAEDFEPLDFLALLTSHMPSRGESVTRYYGHYSCRSRGERIKVEAAINKAELLEIGAGEPFAEAEEPRKRPSLTWAQCFKLIYEIDPMQCPKCQASMKIIAFITDTRELQAIMKSQGISKACAPPPIPKSRSKAQVENESYDEFFELPVDDYYFS